MCINYIRMNIQSIILFAIIIILCYLICMTKCKEHLTDTDIDAVANISAIYDAQNMKMRNGTFTNKLNVGIVPTNGIVTDTTENVISMTGTKMTIAGAKNVVTDLSIKNKTIIDKGDVMCSSTMYVGTPKLDATGIAVAIPADQTIINKGTITANKIQLKRNILYFRQKVPVTNRESIAKISYKKDITTRDPPVFFKANEWIIIIAGIHQWGFGKDGNADTWYINHVSPIMVTESGQPNVDYWYVICKYRLSAAGYVTDSNVDVMICAIPMDDYGIEMPIMPESNIATTYLEKGSNHLGYLGKEGTNDSAYLLTLINKQDASKNVSKWVP